MNIHKVYRGTMNSSYCWTVDGRGRSVPSLFLQGTRLTSAGFTPEDKLTVLVGDRYLIIVRSDDVTDELRKEVGRIESEGRTHQGRIL